MSIKTLDQHLEDRIPVPLRPIVAGWLSGTTSVPITVLKLSMALGTVEEIRAAIGGIIAAISATFPAGAAPRERAEALRSFLEQHQSGLNQVKTFLEFEKKHQHSGSPDPVTRWATLFDAWVRQSEGASVALYSFGDEALLDALTSEVVALLNRWNLVNRDGVILQVGCGAGRFEAALGPQVRAAYGIDISAEMIAAAERRCRGLENVYLRTSSGRDLSLFADDFFDLVYAIDAFPYLHASGFDLVEKHFAEVCRVLRKGGTFVIINFSYRGSTEIDRSEIQELARKNNFAVLDDGVSPFTLWDGVAWRLRLRRE
jgi:SAM-dependent methyltransferase